MKDSTITKRRKTTYVKKKKVTPYQLFADGQISYKILVGVFKSYMVNYIIEKKRYDISKIEDLTELYYYLKNNYGGKEKWKFRRALWEHRRSGVGADFGSEPNLK